MASKWRFHAAREAAWELHRAAFARGDRTPRLSASLGEAEIAERIFEQRRDPPTCPEHRWIAVAAERRFRDAVDQLIKEVRAQLPGWEPVPYWETPEFLRGG